MILYMNYEQIGIEEHIHTNTELSNSAAPFPAKGQDGYAEFNKYRRLIYTKIKLTHKRTAKLTAKKKDLDKLPNEIQNTLDAPILILSTINLIKTSLKFSKLNTVAPIYLPLAIVSTQYNAAEFRTVIRIYSE